jgi:hypothetical protein
VTNSALEVLRKQNDERERPATDPEQSEGMPAPYPALPALAS